MTKPTKRPAKVTAQLIAALCSTTGCLLAVAAPSDNEAVLSAARQHYARGAYVDVTNLLGPLLAARDEDTPVEATLLTTESLRHLGQSDRAWRLLQRELPGAVGSLDEPRLQARAGAVRLAQGELDSAGTLLHAALSREEQLPPMERAALYNELGLLEMRSQDPVRAARFFEQAIEAARAGADEINGARYELNLALAYLERLDLALALELAGKLEATTAKLAGTQRIQQHLTLGDLYRRAVADFDADAKHYQDAYRNWLTAANLAEAGGEQRLLSYAYGLLGTLYEATTRFEESLYYANRAVFAAQLAQADDILYRWEWLAGRAHAALEDPTASLQALRRTVTALRRIRPELDNSAAAFSDIVGPIYYQYADLLLISAQHADARRKEELLLEARDTIEELKFAEVNDYFGDQCVAARGTARELGRVDERASVLYPVILEDRLELLLSRGTEISEYEIAIDRTALEALVNQTRRELQFGSAAAHLAGAQDLYELLIQPIAGELERHQTETLVFVPDGVLRTLPIAALHDGDRYLVEKLAVTVTPGLTLTDPRPLPARNLSVFAGGISEAVQGFRALPGVERELTMLADAVGASVVRNRDFSSSLIESRLAAGGYEVVHFATHGSFGGSYADSYLLTYSDQLPMDQLSRSIASRELRTGPLELLVMSACETAAGDDRAALGLAGVALRAGARSALATLWAVDDAATARLMDDFYRALTMEGLSKAESLRQAQLTLLQDPYFSHPSNWAPLVLIGNWL